MVESGISELYQPQTNANQRVSPSGNVNCRTERNLTKYLLIWRQRYTQFNYSYINNRTYCRFS